MLRWLRTFFRFGAPANAGTRGEQHAAKWLRTHCGYTVVARNWRDPRDRRREIDLVCRDGDILVFVEVKARSSAALVPGYFAVDDRKKRVMSQAIDAYLARLPTPPRTFRFDVVEVVHEASGEPKEVLHFQNIPLFSKHYRG